MINSSVFVIKHFFLGIYVLNYEIENQVRA